MIWKTTLAFLAALFLSLGINAQTPDLRECTNNDGSVRWNCPSNNFTLDDVYLTLVDSNGDPINTTTCNSGDIEDAKVILNYTSNANNTINSTRVFADLIINEDVIDINKYIGDVPGYGQTQTE